MSDIYLSYQDRQPLFNQEPDDKMSLKRQQFFVAQRKKQEELRATKELEQQRKLQEIRNQGSERPPEGNLVTKCPRPKSSRIRVVKFQEQEGGREQRAMSAAPAVMSCREQRAMSAAPAVISCRSPSQSFEDDNRVMRVG